MTTSTTSITTPVKKVIDDYHKIKTETSEFEINFKDIESDGSFPRARRLSPIVTATATAKRKKRRRFLCRCKHEITAHSTSCESFIMFLLGVPISTDGFNGCSVNGCYCQRFVCQVCIEDLEDVGVGTA